MLSGSRDSPRWIVGAGGSGDHHCHYYHDHSGHCYHHGHYHMIIYHVYYYINMINGSLVTSPPFFWRRGLEKGASRIASADLLLIAANPHYLELWQIHNSGKSQQSRLGIQRIQCVHHTATAPKLFYLRSLFRYCKVKLTSIATIQVSLVRR